MNTSLAANFINDNGNAVELARLDYLVAQKRPAPQVIAHFATDQRNDGGWPPFWAEGYSSLDATCFRLAQAEQLGLDAQTPFIQKALDFLSQRQLDNGWFEEDQAVTDVAPPWAQPSDEAARLYLTANCGYWLAVFGDVDESAEKASTQLRTALNSGQMPTFLHAHWLACGLWQKTNQAEAVDAVTEFLRSKLTELSPNNLTWMIVALRTAGFSKDHALIQEAVEHLLTKQMADWRWQSDDAMERDVHVTLEALRALQLCDYPLH